MKSWWLAPAETRSRFIRPGRKGPKTGPKGQSYEAPSAATCGNAGAASYGPAERGRKRVRRASRMKPRRRRPAETRVRLHTTQPEQVETDIKAPVV